ncbi:MAG: hypothetical protein ACR2H5_12465 [Ktedonobacteraceae bacterium]
MDPLLIANTLSITLFLVALFIAIRAFFLYFQTRSRRVFILALSMGVISLTAAAGFLGDNVTTISLNVDWFNYIGQTVSFLFILLSLTSSSDDYLRGLMRWHIVISILLLSLFLLAPVLPPEFPDPVLTKSLLSGSRGLICAVIFFVYFSAFMSKETRFSLLMSVAFLLFSIGYLMILPKYSISGLDVIDRLGDTTRIVGLVTLFINVLRG